MLKDDDTTSGTMVARYIAVVDIQWGIVIAGIVCEYFKGPHGVPQPRLSSDFFSQPRVPSSSQPTRIVYTKTGQFCSVHRCLSLFSNSYPKRHKQVTIL